MIRSRRRAETRAPSRRAHPMMACCANIPMSSLSRPRGLGVLRRNSLLQLPIRTERTGFCAVWLVRQLDVRDSAHFILFASWTCKNLRGSPWTVAERAEICAGLRVPQSTRINTGSFPLGVLLRDLRGRPQFPTICKERNAARRIPTPIQTKERPLPCANS